MSAIGLQLAREKKTMYGRRKFIAMNVRQLDSKRLAINVGGWTCDIPITSYIYPFDLASIYFYIVAKDMSGR